MIRLSIFQQTALVSGLFFVLNSCGPGSNADPDTRESGTIHISADESFKPVLDSHIQVYEGSYPETRIIAHYKPEADCFRDFGVDSIRMIIATRGASEEERLFMIDSMKVDPKTLVIAYDAIAVIVHREAPDSLFTMNELKDILKGRFKKNLIPVFDGLNATSTVRFIIDSVLRGDSLSSKVTAAKSSEQVIDYVSRTPNTIGFIGVSWIGNRQDTMQASFLTKVKVAHIESADIPGNYVLPVQLNIYNRRYPMVRDLVYTLKENHQGLGHGFANFLRNERGQLIFKKAYLMPAQLNLRIREVSLRE